MEYMYGVPGVLACCVDDVPVPSCLRDFYGATPMCMILARASAVPGVWYPVECRSYNSDHTPASWQERTSLTSRLPSRDTPTSPSGTSAGIHHREASDRA